MSRMHTPPHPGKILKQDILEPLNISIKEASLKLQVSSKALHDLVAGRSGVSVVMALKLSKVFKTTPDFWLNMQNQYDIWKVSQTINLDELECVNN